VTHWRILRLWVTRARTRYRSFPWQHHDRGSDCATLLLVLCRLSSPSCAPVTQKTAGAPLHGGAKPPFSRSRGSRGSRFFPFPGGSRLSNKNNTSECTLFECTRSNLQITISRKGSRSHRSHRKLSKIVENCPIPPVEISLAYFTACNLRESNSSPLLSLSLSLSLSFSLSSDRKMCTITVFS